MDLGTGLTVVGAALSGKELLLKMLGPTADYLGENLKDLVKKRLDTTNKIFQNGATKLGGKIEEDGNVSPRVLKDILNEGSFCDNEVAIDYYGGILASSRSRDHRDDRGVYFNKIVSSMSTYQLRTHCIFYNVFKEQFDGKIKNVLMSFELEKNTCYISYKNYAGAMDFSEEEMKQFNSIIPHCLYGLISVDLLKSKNLFFGMRELFHNLEMKVESPGISFTPSILGMELFLWANGSGDLDVNKYLTNEFTPLNLSEIDFKAQSTYNFVEQK
jgi:hypothetical protein